MVCVSVAGACGSREDVGATLGFVRPESTDDQPARFGKVIDRAGLTVDVEVVPDAPELVRVAQDVWVGVEAFAFSDSLHEILRSPGRRVRDDIAGTVIAP